MPPEGSEQARELAPEQAANAATATSNESTAISERNAAIIARANAAIAAGNPLDLEAARFELDGIALTAAEASVVQSFVNGAIAQKQASIGEEQRQGMDTLLQKAQTLGPNAREEEIQKLREAAEDLAAKRPGATLESVHAAGDKAVERAAFETTGEIIRKEERLNGKDLEGGRFSQMVNPRDFADLPPPVDYGTGRFTPLAENSTTPGNAQGQGRTTDAPSLPE